MRDEQSFTKADSFTKLCHFAPPPLKGREEGAKWQSSVEGFWDILSVLCWSMSWSATFTTGCLFSAPWKWEQGGAFQVEECPEFVFLSSEKKIRKRRTRREESRGKRIENLKTKSKMLEFYKTRGLKTICALGHAALNPFSSGRHGRFQAAKAAAV